MGCKFQEKCGGCCFRDLTIEQYREKKFKHFKDILTLGLGIKEKIFDEPCFISDGTRRRASFTFEYKISLTKNCCLPIVVLKVYISFLFE